MMGDVDASEDSIGDVSEALGDSTTGPDTSSQPLDDVIPSEVPASLEAVSSIAALGGPDDNTNSSSNSNRKNRWPTYFFPALNVQRMAFCLEILKMEDIRSVCEVGCGQGAVLRPMTNGASHIDAFPEPILDEEIFNEDEQDDEPVTSVDETVTETKAQEDDAPASPTSLAKGVFDRPLQPAGSSTSLKALAPLSDAGEVTRESNDPPSDSGCEKADDNESEDSKGRSPRSAPSVSPPRSTPEPVASTSKLEINKDLLLKYRALPSLRAQDKELHLRRIAGLDIVEDHLLEAIEATAPPPEEPSPFSTYYSFSTRERWEDLRVEIWQGSLDVFNNALDNFEAIVMTEVIEHLYEKQLDKFPELLFGSYRPRIIVITTPNYDFNKYFGKAKNDAKTSEAIDAATLRETGERAEDETKNSFKDPTGRTDRYFRDSDHKFEWTEDEFEDWCKMITFKYDYTVEISGVGSLRNFLGKGGMHTSSSAQTKEDAEEEDASQGKAPPAHIQEMLDSVPDPSQMFATQTAVFRRKFAYESERSPRSPIQMPLAFYGIRPPPRGAQRTSPAAAAAVAAASGGSRKAAKQRSSNDDDESSTNRSPDQRHRLLKSHYFKACNESGNAKSSAKIRAILDELMREKMRSRSATVRELWGRNEIARACGGYISKLMLALIRDGKQAWDLEMDPQALANRGQVEDAVRIVLKDFVEPEKVWDEAEEQAATADQSDDDVQWSDDDIGDGSSRRAKVGPAGPGQTSSTGAEVPKLSKNQRKKLRIANAPFLNPIFPLANEPVWMPQEGSKDAEEWADWANPARASTMITEDEWHTETAATENRPGWD